MELSIIRGDLILVDRHLIPVFKDTSIGASRRALLLDYAILYRPGVIFENTMELRASGFG